MNVDHFTDKGQLFIRNTELNNQLYAQMKGFLKQKLAFLLPKKTKAPELLARKKTDIIQYIYA